MSFTTLITIIALGFNFGCIVYLREKTNRMNEKIKEQSGEIKALKSTVRKLQGKISVLEDKHKRAYV